MVKSVAIMNAGEQKYSTKELCLDRNNFLNIVSNAHACNVLKTKVNNSLNSSQNHSLQKMAARKLKLFLEKQLVIAVLERNSSYVKQLVQFCEATSINKDGDTLLHLYATAEITEILIKKTNVDLNTQNIFGRTPLHMWFRCVSVENDQININLINQTEFD